MALLLQQIAKKGMFVTMGECYRTHDQAMIYVNKGMGIKDSLHCKRLAVDLNLIGADGKYLKDKEWYEPFGRYWESIHTSNRWGGDWKRADLGHFEMLDS